MPTDAFHTIPTWKFPDWQPQFQDAILEFDTQKLPARINQAATAILARLQAADAKPEELRALANALRSVGIIETKRLNKREHTSQKRCA
jgi:hypothetical protein